MSLLSGSHTLSTRHNALYDDHVLIAALVFMCGGGGASANRALKAMKGLYEDARIPTGQWLPGMLGKLPHELVEKRCQAVPALAAGSVIRRGLIPTSAAIAPDVRLRPLAGGDGGDGGRQAQGRHHAVRRVPGGVRRR